MKTTRLECHHNVSCTTYRTSGGFKWNDFNKIKAFENENYFKVIRNQFHTNSDQQTILSATILTFLHRLNDSL